MCSVTGFTNPVTLIGPFSFNSFHLLLFLSFSRLLQSEPNIYNMYVYNNHAFDDLKDECKNCYCLFFYFKPMKYLLGNRPVRKSTFTIFNYVLSLSDDVDDVRHNKQCQTNSFLIMQQRSRFRHYPLNSLLQVMILSIQSVYHS